MSTPYSTPYIPPPDTYGTQHHGTQHLEVNNTRLRRFLTLLALKTTGRWYHCRGPCVPISRHLVVKAGRSTHLTEAATMRFVAANTSVPVPRVHCAFVQKNEAYLVVERIRDRGGGWRSVTESDYESVFAQLRAMMDELRALEPPRPDVGVESCVGGSLRDPRIARSRPRFGPFKTIREFHSWLREGFRPEDYPEPPKSPDLDEGEWGRVKDMVAKQDAPWPQPPIFTHGDLNPTNVMVRGDKVLAIVDWETAGWYPYYWEYTAAWHGNKTRLFWQDSLPRFLDTYPEELMMEITRQKQWGDF